MRVGRSLDDLGTRRLSWLDLKAVVEHAGPGNAIDIDVHGERALYGLGEVLALQILNVLREANWQRGGDERAPRPKPLTVPGTMAPDSDSGDSAYGSDAIPIRDFADWWDSTE